MNKRHFIIPIFVPHIGCPHDCVFCNQNTITGKKENVLVEDVNAESTENTINEYLYTINSYKGYKVVEVSFFGGTFTAISKSKQEELLKVAKKYKNLGLIDYIRLSTRPDYIDEEELDLLKKYQVDIIELGVQSLDQEVLNASGRGHDVNCVYSACELIKSYGFILGLQIMLGLPKDNFFKDIKTTKIVCDLKPDLCRIYPALVIRDTPMEEMLNRREYIPYNLDQAVEICSFVLSMLISSNINVIRVGLQPTDSINDNAEVIAGPFHPAFKELVESNLINEGILNLVKDIDAKKIFIYIHPKNISKLYANKKYYFNKYKKHKDTQYIVLQDDKLQRDYIIIKCNDKKYNFSFNENMKNKVKEMEDIFY